jgi:hypothetical protein
MTNTKLRLLPRADINRRSAAYRRVEDLTAAIESDLGGGDRLSTGERQIVQRAAVTCALLEDMEACWLAGKPIDAAQYTTLTNSLRRLLETAGLKRVPKDITPSLEEYLKQVNEPKPERTE